METILFNAAYTFYSLCLLFYLLYIFTKQESFSRWGFGVLAVALALHVGSLVTRTVTARHHYYQQAEVLRQEGKVEAAIGAERAGNSYVPWSNWFESFSFFGGIIAAIYLVIGLRLAIPILGAFIMPISWCLLTIAFFSDRSLKELMPALHSYWMAIHVPIMFFSYSLLGVAFAVGVAYLIQEHQIKSKHPNALTFRLPSLEDLDDLIYKLIMVAFPPLTLGIFLGGVWAYSAWGRFWGWDPKETWALITWFVYVIYLHLRLFVGWRGRKTAYLSMAGFLVVLFTYAGVNYLSPLHGFLSGTGR